MSSKLKPSSKSAYSGKKIYKFHFFSEARYTLAPAGGWLLSIFRLFFITYCKYLRINIRFGFDIALLSRQLVRTQPS